MGDLFDDYEREIDQRKDEDMEMFGVEDDNDNLHDDILEQPDLDMNEGEEEEDEDLKLFLNHISNDNEDVKVDGKYNDVVKGLIDKAQNKFKSKMEQEQRRNRRVEKIQHYYFSRAYIILQVGRCLKIAEQNFGYCSEVISAILQSIMGHKNRKNSKPLGSLTVKEIMGLFNKCFRNKLDMEID